MASNEQRATSKPIPSQWTTEGFMQRYEDWMKQSETYYIAYQATEREHTELFGKPRFKSYDAFRSSRNNLLFKKGK